MMKSMIKQLWKRLTKGLGGEEKKAKQSAWGRNQIKEIARLKGKLILM
jgi:hypothetical protein